MRSAAGQHQHLEAFLEMLAAERGAAQNTLQAYRRDLEDLLAFLEHRAKSLAAVAPADIGAYLRVLSEAGLAPASRARRLSAIRQLFKFLVAEGVMAEDPVLGFAGPKQGRPLPKTLSVAEVDRLIETARLRTQRTRGRDRVRALRLHALIETLYATGLRVTELVTLPRSVLTGDGRVLTVKGKGGRERIVPLTPAARAALDRYLNVGREKDDDVAPMIVSPPPALLDRCEPLGCTGRDRRRSIEPATKTILGVIERTLIEEEPSEHHRSFAPAPRGWPSVGEGL